MDSSLTMSGLIPLFGNSMAFTQYDFGQYGVMQNERHSANAGFSLQQHPVVGSDNDTAGQFPTVIVDQHNQMHATRHPEIMVQKSERSDEEALTVANAGIPYEKQKAACQICGILILRKTLARHIQNKHTEGFLHECNVCQQQFKRLDIFQRHQREQHTRNRSASKCDYCGKIVKRRVMRSHLESSSCLAARRRYSGSTQRASAFAIREEYILPLSAQFTIRPNVDAVIICSYLYSTSLFLTLKVEEGQLVAHYVPRQVQDELRFELETKRSRALIATREMVRREPSSAESILAILLLSFADTTLFGAESSDALAHTRYLSSICKSNRPADIPCRKRFEEVGYYIARNRQTIGEISRTNMRRYNGAKAVISWLWKPRPWRAEKMAQIVESGYRELFGQITGGIENA